jgi:hypothetical protein
VHRVALAGVAKPSYGILDIIPAVDFLKTLWRHQRTGPQQQPEIADIVDPFWID